MAFAYSYLRFSSAKQSAGDSIPRQVADTKAWCERKRVKLDESLSLRDEGVSAFRGKHRENPDTNALAGFLARVKSGKVPRGSYLVIESLDRLTREKVRKALALLLSLIEDGIRVVQLKPVEAVYDEEVEPTQLMMAVMELSRGHGESQMKSDRVGKAWAAKKRRAREGKEVTTRRLPGWLRYDEEARRIAPDPARVAVVKRIYALARDGNGVAAIAMRLNADGVPVFGRTKYLGKQVAWDQTTVSWILRSRAVLGEYQPKKYGSGRPVADGEPITNYFPAVVGNDLFYAVQSGLASRTRSARGRRGNHVNLFAGLLRDARDGGTMTYFHRGVRPPVIVPTNSRRMAGLKWTTFPASVFDVAVLSQLREVPASDVWGGSDAGRRAEEIAGRLAEVDGLRTQWQAKMDNPDLVDVVAAKLADLSARHRDLTAQLADARQQAAASLSDAWGTVPTLVDVLAADPSDEVRLKVRAALRRTVQSVYCLFVGIPGRAERLAAITVTFAGSAAIRNFLIFYRPPRGDGLRGRTAGAWAVRSSATSEGLLFMDFDLRMERLTPVYHEDVDQWTGTAGWREEQASLETYPADILKNILRDGSPVPAR